MATNEPRPFLYDTLSPLLDYNDPLYGSPSREILLDETPDVSSISKIAKRKKKTKKSQSAMEDDDELIFLNKTKVPCSDPSPERNSTVFRREITDPVDIMHKDTSDGEIQYLSLEASGSNSPKDLSDEPVTPLMVPQVKDKVKAVQEFSWTDGHKNIRSPLLLLHQEITDFCHFLSPTPDEHTARLAAIGRVSEVIMFIWPNCEVKVFGSFETGLYLPSSDIDAVILNSNVQVPQKGLQALAKALSKKSVATKMQVIGKARVPIVKFIEKESNVAFDVSFDVQNGPEAAKFIKDAISKIPPLRPLCLILKIFLQQRELNEVYSGGIGSYALLVMLITHLQLHWSQESSTGRSTLLERNLGILLIDFFDLYGRKLNACNVGVSCRSGGQFFRKNLRGFTNSKRPNLLSVEDPQAPENDIGKNSYNILQVRAAFAMAHRKLTDFYIDDFVPSQHSILGRIIRIDAKLLERKAGFMRGPQLDAFLLNRWQLCDDEPLPRGGELFEGVHGQSYAKRGLKRNWNEEKLNAKKDEKKNHSTMHHSEGHKSKKRKQFSDDETHSATRHGSRYKKMNKYIKKVEPKQSGSDHNNSFGTRISSNFRANKNVRYF